MARANYGATLGQSLGEGRFNSTATRTTPGYTNVTAAIVAAQADGTIAGNAPALALVTAIQTALDAAYAADLVIDINAVTITTRNKFDSAMRAARQAIEGSSLLTA